MSDTINPISAMAADAMVAKKERLIEAALNHYFGGDQWKEHVLENLACIDITPDGVETFRIAGTNLLRFYPMRTHVEIDGLSAKVKLSQDYQILYE